MRLEKCFVFGQTLKLPYVRPKQTWCKQEKSFFYIIEQLLTENMCAHRRNKETEKSAKVHKQKILGTVREKKGYYDASDAHPDIFLPVFFPGNRVPYRIRKFEKFPHLCSFPARRETRTMCHKNNFRRTVSCVHFAKKG